MAQRGVTGLTANPVRDGAAELRSGRTRPRGLVYVNQVYSDDSTGQGTFERELTSAILERAEASGDLSVKVFTIRQPGGREPADGDPRIVRLVLDKRTSFGYLAHQARLFVHLFRELWRLRGHDVTVYARYAPSMVAPALLAIAMGRRLVMRTGPVVPNLRIHRKNPNHLVYFAVRAGHWLFSRKAARIIVVARRTGEWVKETYRFARDKVVIVPNGVNLRALQPVPPDRRRWNLSEAAFVMGFVGYIYEDQGLDTVIRALARVRARGGNADVQLLVVGDGPSLEEWRQLAEGLGVAPSVVWAGRRPHGEIASAIAACDVMIFPCTRRPLEVVGSSAIKLFEYLACDRPIMASSAEDHEFIEREGVGWLVEPENVDAWEGAIRERLQVGRIDLRGRARRLAERDYGFEVVADRILGACFDNWAPAAVTHTLASENQTDDVRGRLSTGRRAGQSDGRESTRAADSERASGRCGRPPVGDDA